MVAQLGLILPYLWQSCRWPFTLASFSIQLIVVHGDAAGSQIFVAWDGGGTSGVSSRSHAR